MAARRARKSLAANFRFQGCCLPVPTAPISNDAWVRTSSLGAGSDGRDQLVAGKKRAKVDRSLRLRWRLESERAPLIRPGHRQVDETLQAKATRQASLDCGLDDLRREESERQGHSDRTHSPALPRSERLQSGGNRREVRPASGARRGGLRSGPRARWRASGGHRSSHRLHSG